MQTQVAFRPLVEENLFRIMNLKTREDQRDSVIPWDCQVKYVHRYAANSLAEAAVTEGSWIRAAYASDHPVGFLWVQPGPGELIIRRLLVDAQYQGRGYGRRIMERMLEAFPGDRTVSLQCLPCPGGPAGFFETIGFVPTGEMSGEEVIMRWVPGARAPARQQVSLRPITAANLAYLCSLDPRGPVAPNAVSVVQGHFEVGASLRTVYLRAIYAGELPVGLIMLGEDRSEEEPEFFLWRLMVDARHQRAGYGSRALELLLDHVRTRPGAQEMVTSCDPGPDGPEVFYRKMGFEPTGTWLDDEMIMKRPL